MAQNAKAHGNLHLTFTTLPWIICCPCAIFLRNHASINNVWVFFSFFFSHLDRNTLLLAKLNQFTREVRRQFLWTHCGSYWITWLNEDGMFGGQKGDAFHLWKNELRPSINYMSCVDNLQRNAFFSLCTSVLWSMTILILLQLQGQATYLYERFNTQRRTEAQGANYKDISRRRSHVEWKQQLHQTRRNK